MEPGPKRHEIVIQLPRVLAELTACGRRIPVRGCSVAEALEDLVRKHPALGLHIFDDRGALRRHVLCFRNRIAIENRAQLHQPLAPGDHLALVNSVAGG